MNLTALVIRLANRSLASSCRTPVIISAIIHVIVGWNGLLFAATLDENQDQGREYDIKAALVLNIMRFSTLPQLVDTGQTLRICVVGDEDIGNAFYQLADRSVSSHRITVSIHNRMHDFGPCNLVYVIGLDHQRLNHIAEQISRQPTLLVSEVEQFSLTKGMLNFIERGNRIIIQVILKNIHGANIKLSSRLLKLVELVDR